MVDSNNIYYLCFFLSATLFPKNTMTAKTEPALTEQALSHNVQASSCKVTLPLCLLFQVVTLTSHILTLLNM